MMPILYWHNNDPSVYPDNKRHGTEIILQPYLKTTELFRSPLDTGTPWLQADPGFKGARPSTYFEGYGTSYRFLRCDFSFVQGETTFANKFYPLDWRVKDTEFVEPARTRILRLDMLGIFEKQFDPDCKRYGYWCGYYTDWDPAGGSVLFNDAHVKRVNTHEEFDNEYVDPAGHRSGEPNSSGRTWFQSCDT